MSVVGMEESRATVYGWRGSPKTVAASASSTTLPRYMTQMRSEMYRTTDRSCEMNIYVRCSFCFSSCKRLMICDWIDTSSAETHSSHTTNFGCTASARAMEMR